MASQSVLYDFNREYPGSDNFPYTIGTAHPKMTVSISAPVIG